MFTVHFWAESPSRGQVDTHGTSCVTFIDGGYDLHPPFCFQPLHPFPMEPTVLLNLLIRSSQYNDNSTAWESINVSLVQLKKTLLTSTICQVLSLVQNEHLLSIGWMDEWMNEQINENLASGGGWGEWDITWSSRNKHRFPAEHVHIQNSAYSKTSSSSSY